MMKPKILIIDDDENILSSLSKFFQYKNYFPVLCSTGSEGVKFVEKYNFEVVILDKCLKDMDGIECLKKIKSVNGTVPVIMFTAYGDVSSAVEAVKNGAFDYLCKPISNEELLLNVEKAIKYTNMEKELFSVKEKLKQYSYPENIVVENQTMKELYSKLKEVAETDYNVLLEGETGVGKEIFAHYIHSFSKRNNKPFIIIDSGAISPSLIESELFGYEKGAFTGADRRYIGKIESAHQGTLFFDEISNLPLDLQPKFLRLLEQKTFFRLGGNDIVKIDVRFIFATNVDLDQLCKEGKFRQDLFYRVAEYRFKIPPLRERKDEILPLAKFFLSQVNKELNKNIVGFSTEVQEIFLKYPWDGNVRELKNVIKSACLLAERLIEKQHIDERIRKYVENNTQDNGLLNECFDLSCNIENLEKNLIQKVLIKTNFNKNKAAKLLKISRKSLYSKIQRYSIQCHLKQE